jgi:hypothetical protein
MVLPLELLNLLQQFLLRIFRVNFVTHDKGQVRVAHRGQVASRHTRRGPRGSERVCSKP